MGHTNLLWILLWESTQIGVKTRDVDRAAVLTMRPPSLLALNRPPPVFLTAVLTVVRAPMPITATLTSAAACVTRSPHRGPRWPPAHSRPRPHRLPRSFLITVVWVSSDCDSSPLVGVTHGRQGTDEGGDKMRAIFLPARGRNVLRALRQPTPCLAPKNGASGNSTGVMELRGIAEVWGRRKRDLLLLQPKSDQSSSSSSPTLRLPRRDLRSPISIVGSPLWSLQQPQRREEEKLIVVNIGLTFGQ